MLWSLINLLKSGMVAHACDPRTWEVEAGRSNVQSQPQLHSKFEATPWLKKFFILKETLDRYESIVIKPVFWQLCPLHSAV